jgi:hypothetical protein
MENAAQIESQVGEPCGRDLGDGHLSGRRDDLQERGGELK